MNPEMKKRLIAILSKGDGAWTESDLRFLRARASYLSPEQLARLNSAIKLNGDKSLKTVAKKDLQDVSEPEVIDEVQDAVDVENVVPEGSPLEAGDEANEDDADPDMPEDSGELEVVESEATTGEDGEEIDIDAMNLEQLKVVAKELGIKGVHFYKDAEALREKILATYETSNEGKADAESEDAGSEVV